MLLYNTLMTGLAKARAYFQPPGSRIPVFQGNIPGGRSAPEELIRGEDPELPWLREQMRAYAGFSNIRRTAFTDNYTGETREMRLKYRWSLAEPAVKAALLGKIISVCSLQLQVKPRDRFESRAFDVAQCCKDSVEQSDYGTPGVLWGMLSGGLIDGWSISEKVWKIGDRGRWRGHKMLGQLKPKDTRYIFPEVDPFLNVNAWYSLRGNSGRSFDPADFVHFNYLPLFGNPTGMSDLRASYRAIEALPAVVRMRVTFLEKYKGPFLKGKLTDKQLKAKMASELSQARAQGWIVLDQGSDLEVIDMAVSGPADFQACITDLRQEVAIGISGAFLHMLTGETPGARGDSQVQQETTEGFVWILAHMAANCIEKQIFPDIVDYNFGSQVTIPECTLEAYNPADVIANLKIDEFLNNLGLDLDIEGIYDRAKRSAPKTQENVLKGRTQPPAILPGQSPFGGGGGFPAQFADRLAWHTFADEPGFTGTITDKLGREYKYVDGVRVAAGETEGEPEKRVKGDEVQADSETIANGQKAIGKALAPADFAAIGGAQPDSKVTFRKTPEGIAIEARGDGYLVETRVSMGSNGPIVHLDNVLVAKEKQGKGLGFKLISDQIENAQKHGAAEITAFATGGPGEKFNGYYTWPKMGFDGPISNEVRSGLPAEFHGAKTVLDLFEMPGGKEAWKAHGQAINVSFDLTSGSRSQKMFDAYRQERDVKSGEPQQSKPSGSNVASTTTRLFGRGGEVGPGHEDEAKHRAEVEANMQALTSMSKANLIKLAKEVGLEAIFPSQEKLYILSRFRNRMLVAIRARERAEV